MSLHSYMVSYDLATHDYPFEALIMAAMRKADTRNSRLLHDAFPAIHDELYARYNAPGGRIGDEPVTVPPADLVTDPDCRDGKHGSCVGGPCQCPCHAEPATAKVEIPPHIQAEIDKLREAGEDLFIMPRDDSVPRPMVMTSQMREAMSESGLAMAARVLKPSAFERLTGKQWRGTPEARAALEATGEES